MEQKIKFNEEEGERKEREKRIESWGRKKIGGVKGEGRQEEERRKEKEGWEREEEGERHTMKERRKEKRMEREGKGNNRKREMLRRGCSIVSGTG